MRVPNNTYSSNLQGELNRLRGNQLRLQNQISSGKRIEDPSDDPESMNRILQLETDKRLTQQYGENIERAQEVVSFSYQTMDQILAINTRASELAILGTDIVTATNRGEYASEVNQLIEQAVDLANTIFKGDYLFAGTLTDDPPFEFTRDAEGQIDTITYVGSASAPEINIAESTRLNPALDGAGNQRTANMIAELIALRDRLEAGDVDGLRTSLDSLEVTEDEILLNISEQGSNQLRLDIALKQNNARRFEIESGLSREADVDITEAVLQLNQTQVAYQAALQTGSQVLRTSLLNYI